MRKCPHQDSLCPVDTCLDNCIYTKEECEHCKLLKGNNQSKFINIEFYKKNNGWTERTQLKPKFCPMCGQRFK